MGTTRPSRPAYPPELRARAVERARASELPPSQVARDRGLAPDTMRRWLRQADVDTGRLQGATTDEKAELARRRELALLREERDILQKATAYFVGANGPRWTGTCASPPGPPSIPSGPSAACWACRARATSPGGPGRWRRGSAPTKY